MTPPSHVNNTCIYYYKPHTQQLIIQTHDLCLTQRLCEMFVYNQAHYPEEEEGDGDVCTIQQRQLGADDCAGSVPGLVA